MVSVIFERMENEEIRRYDEWGRPYVLDENGRRRPAMQAEKISKPGEFAIYDDSQGHCSLCGRLTCNGPCFK